MSSSIRLTIIKTKTAKIVAMQEIVITLLLIAAVAAIFLLSSGTSEHETEWSFLDSKSSAFATNNTSSIRGNESIKIDNDNNNIPFYNSSHINSPYIKEYSMPKGTWPNGILVDKKGIVWTVGTKSQTLISFDPKQGRIVSEYPIKKNGYETTNKVQLSSSSAAASSKQAKLPMMTWAMVE